ncbi:hypothetical protein AN958_07504 [Leucoagaricus sp. SymC.cos]|nr:hypothetical protein AN958_07504 [Leucoagaricus sp. SymC.cos]
MPDRPSPVVYYCLPRQASARMPTRMQGNSPPEASAASTSRLTLVPTADSALGANGVSTAHVPRHWPVEDSQTNIRTKIQRKMEHEMLTCSLDDFMGYYAPSKPSESAVDYIYAELKADRAGGGILKEVTQDSWILADFEVKPSERKEREVDVFDPLEKIVSEICNLEDDRPSGPGECKRTRSFYYRNCPSQPTGAEITGGTFKVDANIRFRQSDKNRVIASDVAVIAEYKKSTKETLSNNSQLVSEATFIMDADPCHMWIYGITIEDEEMSIWYFSRSHSVKSHSFKFAKDIKKFIRVCLSFLYATCEELGFDPTVKRGIFDKQICYIYQLGNRYFRTVKPLFVSKTLCITGRKTRVWEAIEVSGPDGETSVGEGKKVAVKDVWVDKDRAKEKEIQDAIFARLEGVQLPSPYAQFPSREYSVKQQYRVIYSDVGLSLYDAPSLSTALQAVARMYEALVLLLLAGYVHRDISPGNIILVPQPDNSFVASLSDLEYAKRVDTNRPASTDPKTGTPFFMPFEIHSRRRLHWAPMADTSRGLDDPYPRNSGDGEPWQLIPRHLHVHDVESLWWILAWFPLSRFASEKGRVLGNQVFTNTSTPSRMREELLKSSKLESDLVWHMDERFWDLARLIANVRNIFIVLYQRAEEPMDPNVYFPVFEKILGEFNGPLMLRLLSKVVDVTLPPFTSRAIYSPTFTRSSVRATNDSSLAEGSREGGERKRKRTASSKTTRKRKAIENGEEK